MLWKIAIHGGHLHPDFIRGKLNDRQIHEIAWYYELYPFGHEVDHSMYSKIVASMAGGKPDDYMPQVRRETTMDDMVAGMAGLAEFTADHSIELKED